MEGQTVPGSIRLVRKPEAMQITGDRYTQLHEKIKRGLMVAPVQIGGRAVAFPSDELQAIVQARIAGLSDDDMRALVSKCARRPNFDHPCRLNIDQGWKPVSVEAGCG